METSPSREPLAGVVERVTFHNPETGFCVLQVKVRDQPKPVPLVGRILSITTGEHVQASGTWETSPKHGRQFRAALLESTPPSSLEGMERYLGSGLIAGIGPELAKRLIRAFGEKVFDVIEEHPERLRTVDGIGPVRGRKITSSWKEQRAVREIFVFLQSHGVGTARAFRIFKNYGADAVPLITEDPFRLAREVRGIGFRTADEIAGNLGMAKHAPARARAGLSFTLEEATHQGHCALPEEDLLTQAQELLDIPRTVLVQALEDCLAEGTVTVEPASPGEDGETPRLIYSTPLWRAEKQVGQGLRALATGRPPWPAMDSRSALESVEKKLATRLSESQRQAVALALASRLLVVTGGPGVGKTTLVRAILTLLRARSVQVALCAPTGRAAKRLTESTGVEARTIHRLLEADPRRGAFRRWRENPLELDLLVVDEASMVDVPLMAALVEALPRHAALFLVGDVDQLPSVGPGQVLADVIASGVVPVARLTEIFRQAAQSRIVTNAHRIQAGEMPDLGDAATPPRDGLSDFYFVPAHDAEDGVRKVLHIVQERIPRRFHLDARRQVQVLCPMNRGPLGSRALNLRLQSALNPVESNPSGVERSGWSYRPGDKVMQTTNDYDKKVFNGDVGFIDTIDPQAQKLAVSFDGRLVPYRFSELDQLTLAYAISVHKSQGSEYPAVVLTLAMQHYTMLRRNLLYTAVTRGQRLVVVVGERKAVATAVSWRPSGPGHERRWSRLAHRLAGDRGQR